FFLGGQFFVLDGGDGQEVVPPGDYWIKVEVNPGFDPTDGKCTFAKDSKGKCHNFAESNYDNNSMRALVTIGANNGRSDPWTGKEFESVRLRTHEGSHSVAEHKRKFFVRTTAS